MNSFRVLDAVDDLVDDLVVKARTALVELDEQLARLTAKRATIAQFVDAVRVDIPLAPPTPAAAVRKDMNVGNVRSISTAVAHHPAARKPRTTSHVDYSEVAEWIAAAKHAGSYTVASLAGRFGVPVSTAKNWPGECRRRGLLDVDQFTTEPITKTPVNEQAARAAAADGLS